MILERPRTVWGAGRLDTASIKMMKESHECAYIYRHIRIYMCMSSNTHIIVYIYRETEIEMDFFAFFETRKTLHFARHLKPSKNLCFALVSETSICTNGEGLRFYGWAY